MTLNASQTLIMIAAVALGAITTRFLQFILFPENKKTPPFVMYLGKYLPPAMIGLLVVYCFKNVQLFSAPYALPELIAAACIAGLQLWKRNTLLSIGLGTVLYMGLVQFIF